MKTFALLAIPLSLGLVACSEPATDETAMEADTTADTMEPMPAEPMPADTGMPPEPMPTGTETGSMDDGTMDEMPTE